MRELQVIARAAAAHDLGKKGATAMEEYEAEAERARGSRKIQQRNTKPVAKPVSSKTPIAERKPPARETARGVFIMLLAGFCAIGWVVAAMIVGGVTGNATAAIATGVWVLGCLLDLTSDWLWRK